MNTITREQIVDALNHNNINIIIEYHLQGFEEPRRGEAYRIIQTNPFILQTSLSYIINEVCRKAEINKIISLKDNNIIKFY